MYGPLPPENIYLCPQSNWIKLVCLKMINIRYNSRGGNDDQSLGSPRCPAGSAAAIYRQRLSLCIMKDGTKQQIMSLKS